MMVSVCPASFELVVVYLEVSVDHFLIERLDEIFLTFG